MNTKKTLIRQIMLNGGTIVVVALMLLAQRAWAGPAAQGATPGVMSYQGYLTDQDGTPINGNRDMTFRLYAQPSGGTALWNEAHTGANAVPVTNGLFNVLLGSLQPIPSTVWDSPDLYLEVQVGSQTMTPREQVGRVPYAMAASHALTAESATTAKQLSAPDDDPADAVYVDNSGNVGIGTRSPEAGLEINKGSTNDLALLLNSSGPGWGSGVIFKNTASAAHTYGMYAGDDGHLHLGDVSANADRLRIEKNSDINVYGNIKARDYPLVHIFRVTVTDKMDTGMEYPDWNCVAASWVTRVDIDERHSHWDGAWTYLYGTDPATWHVFADLTSGGKKSVDVDVLCFRKEISDMVGKIYGSPWGE